MTSQWGDVFLAHNGLEKQKKKKLQPSLPTDSEQTSFDAESENSNNAKEIKILICQHRLGLNFTFLKVNVTFGAVSLSQRRVGGGEAVRR